MKVPLSWLKEYIDLPFSVEKISETLTLAGLEVEGIESQGGSFQGVVVGKVLEANAHPNADRLRVAKVSDGKEEFQVVCGAPNCREGLVTAFAKIGATLTDEQGKTWKIKKSKIRDVESYGMLCSSKELGLAEDHDGILELSSSAILGTSLSELYSDVIFDISLTPNLGHCLSIYGIARELSALLKIPIKKFSVSIHEKSATRIQDKIKIQIEDKQNCLRYCCRLIEDISVGPSPDWLVKRLESCGLRSVNNVVDISNLVMLETGQPLHFFDFDQIQGQALTIRSEHSYKMITTLDGQERKLPAHTLLICDTEGPAAIAGIMGASKGSITEHTKNILIEAAQFASEKIRKSTKELGLKTDSSYRFERGIDPCMVPVALDRAAQLLSELSSGRIAQGVLDLNPSPFIAKKIVCREARVNQILGLELSIREIAALLERLNMKIVKEQGDFLEVLIPSYRNDIHEEIDLIEEVARLYGFNVIPKRPAVHVSSSLSDAPIFSFENEIRQALLQEGLQEFISCDLISPALAHMTLDTHGKNQELISVLQSKSADFSTLRPSLLPGLLQILKYNYDHQNQDVSGFEVGRVHFRQDEAFKEQTSVGIILTGNRIPYHFDPKPAPIDFYDLKGILENLLDQVRVDSYAFEISHLHCFQPGRQARIKVQDAYIGAFGEIHPSLLTKLDLPQRVYFAELNIHELIQLKKKCTKVTELPLYPGSERDWTVTLKHEVPVSTVIGLIESASSRLLEKVFLLDLYQSEKLGLDRKNVTLRFLYRDPEKTIAMETVEQEHAKLIQNVAEKLQNCIL